MRTYFTYDCCTSIEPRNAYWGTHRHVANVIAIFIYNIFNFSEIKYPSMIC